jgi:hypothetical protein
MVSKWWMPGRVHFAAWGKRQSKIYVESNDSDFQPIFAEFTSMQTLAIYRRLLLKSKPAGSTAIETKETAGVA